MAENAWRGHNRVDVDNGIGNLDNSFDEGCFTNTCRSHAHTHEHIVRFVFIHTIKGLSPERQPLYRACLLAYQSHPQSTA